VYRLGPVDLHVADSCASAILWSWFNGSEAGNALADVILGTVNPSGKLPFTIPEKLDDSPAHALKTFPGEDKTTYGEGILVGYRWFDTKNIHPAYCFGYGLSYTNFNYDSLQTDKAVYSKKDTVEIMLDLRNTGNLDGRETVQVYVSESEPVVQKPSKVLKAFKKVLVPAGSGMKVTLKIPVADLAWFDEATMSWVVSPGKYTLAAATSSTDIRKKVDIEVK
jgi:beta-glucosidase